MEIQRTKQKKGLHCVLGVLCLVGILFSNGSSCELNCYKWEGRQVLVWEWDITQQELNKLQRRAVSTWIIEGRKIQHREVNRTLIWPSLESRRKYRICLQIFKYLNGLAAPAYLLHDFTIRTNVMHTTHRTRTLWKTTKYQSFFRYNRDKAWNDLPYKLRMENSLSKFKKGLKLCFCTPKFSGWPYDLYLIYLILFYSFLSYFSSSYSFTLLRPIYFSYM